MITFPIAKINIGLRIIRKRMDGFHDIESIFYPIELRDALEYVVAPANAKSDSLVLTGLKIPETPNENLVLKALRLFREHHPLPFLRIHLHKTIPCGGGLGGGSSDGSFILSSINKHMDYNLGQDELRNIATGIGSDSPFFIDPMPSMAKGKGEILYPLKPFLEGMYLVVLHPRININTGEAYRECRPRGNRGSLEQATEKPVIEWKDIIENDFEEYVFRIYPGIGNLKRELYHSGAVYCSMTGSGSAIYGIFGSPPLLPQSLSRFLVYRGNL